MVNFILILFQIIFVTNAALSVSVVSPKGFIHIGSFKSIRAGIQGRATAIDESNYYISANSAAWSTGKADCTNILGPGATLLAIESVNEWDFLKEILEGYGGTTYWTSGSYDGTAKVWRWSANNNPLTTFTTTPWAANNPPVSPNALVRILVTHTSRYSASWSAIANTQLHRYICEVPM